jgi:hypothetical protein
MTIEEISLMFDYGTKEGRAMVMQKMKHDEGNRAKDVEANENAEVGPKQDLEHLERAASRV